MALSTTVIMTPKSTLSISSKDVIHRSIHNRKSRNSLRRNKNLKLAFPRMMRSVKISSRNNTNSISASSKTALAITSAKIRLVHPITNPTSAEAMRQFKRAVSRQEVGAPCSISLTKYRCSSSSDVMIQV